MSKTKQSKSLSMTVRFLKRCRKKWIGYCDVADRERMPNMKAFYLKRVNAAKLIIEQLDSPQPKDNK